MSFDTLRRWKMKFIRFFVFCIALVSFSSFAEFNEDFGSSVPRDKDLVNERLNKALPFLFKYSSSHERLNEKLLEATLKGDRETVQEALEEGADIQSRDSKGNTPFLIAATNGHLDLVQFLLKKGSHIEEANRGKHGSISITALMMASFMGHLDVVEYLIDEKADVNARVTLLHGGAALHLAAGAGHLEIVEALILAGANINATAKLDVSIFILLERGGSGGTPLDAALSQGHIEVANLLESYGATRYQFCSAMDNLNQSSKKECGVSPLFFKKEAENT